MNSSLRPSFPSVPGQLLFDQEAPARAVCNERNHAGGFYRVADLLRETVPGLEGETGFAIVWDYEAAAKWRDSYVRLNFQPSPVRTAPRAQTAA